MARPENPISPGSGAVVAFAEGLRLLRSEAGSPTYRELAQTALFSASVLSSAASGQRLPSLQVTLAFVTACGGDREVWRRRWLHLAALSGVETPTERRPLIGEGITRPAQLPPRHGSLIGSRRELQRSVDTVAATVLVSGPPGVGKRAFALDLAHRLAREKTDGQLYADLGTLTGTPLDAKCLLDDFLSALGVPIARQPVDFERQAELYRALLAERRLLVLLDNVSDERQVRPLVADSSRSTTLIVSVRRLGGFAGAAQLRLGRLSRPESEAILAGAFDTQVDTARAAAGSRIAELCGDLPLALDITIRKLAGRHPRALDSAVSALTDPVRALNWLEHGDLSVRDALRTAWRSVDSEARGLILRAAQAPSPEAAGAVLEAEAEITEDLVEAGLVRRGENSADLRLDRLVRAFLRTSGQSRRTCGQAALVAALSDRCRADGRLSGSTSRSRIHADAGLGVPSTPQPTPGETNSL